MKHKLLSLFALLLVATSVGWAQEESLSFEGTTQDVADFKSHMGIKEDLWKGHIVYGNGYAMTVQKVNTSDNQLTISFTGDGAPEPITIAADEHAIIFGGSKEADLAGNTSITLISGDVGYIIGGGWGTKGKSPVDPKTANVNNVSIDINGGSVGLIFSGGLYRSNVNDITLNIDNATVKHVYCGGFDQGQTSNILDTDWASSVNHVRKSTLMMVNSKILGSLFLGGGQGYSYSQEVEATIISSTLHCGLLGVGSNGRSDKVKVTATGCNFAKASGQTDIIEIAPLNRGIIKDICMIFDNCTFPAIVSDYAAYLGATYAYDGSSKVELGNVDIQFKGGTNVPDMHISSGLDAASVTLTGAKAVVGETVTTDATTIKTYKVGEDKTWIFNNGLEITDDATLDNQGTVHVFAPDSKSLEAAAAVKANKVTLLDDITFSWEKDQYGFPMKVTDMVLDGNGNTMTLADGFGTDTKASKNYAITLNPLSGEVSTGQFIKNLTIDCDQKGNGLNIVNATGVKLENVTVKNSAGAGVIVNNSIVEATDLHTEDNAWGGVNVAIGTSVNIPIIDLAFTFDETSSFKENNQIWSEAEKAQIHAPSDAGWYTYTIKGSDGKSVAFWKNTKDFTVSNVNDLAALLLAGIPSGSTIAVEATATDMLAALNNATDKKALNANIMIACSDAKVYTDENSAWAASTTAKRAQYITLTDQTYALKTVTAQTPVITANLLKASDVEVGQPLSASLLSGGAATVDSKAVSGVFTWKAPEIKVEAEGPTFYAVVFTPTDALRYESVETTVSVKGIQYYTVTAGKCEHGKIFVKEANAANRYKKGTTLTLTTVADPHYTFNVWAEGASSYTVTKEAELKATFKAITRKVSFGEGVTILNNGVAVANNASVIEGSVLTVTAAKDGSRLTTLTCNNSNVINNTVTVADKDLIIAATYAAIPASTQLVTVDYSAADNKNGKVQLYDDKGNIIESGAAVAVGKKVSVVAVPDYGYVANTLTVTGAALTQSTFTVGSEAVTVKQTFKKATYKVTLPEETTEHATVVLAGVTDLKAVPYLTPLTISSATPSTGYTLVSIIVNGKEVVVSGSFTVTADTKVNVVVKELPKIQFTDTKQAYTYNGEAQAFVVRTIPAGIAGVTVSYKDKDGNTVEAKTLKDAGTYTVLASYSGDKYATIKDVEIGTLEIKKAQLRVAIPTPDQVGNGYTLIEENVGEKFQKVGYNLTEEQAKNYEVPTFIIPKNLNDVTSVTLSQPATATGRRALRLSPVTATLAGTNGHIEAYNGPTATTAAYGDQTITLKAIPNAGYSTVGLQWSGVAGITDNGDGTATVTLPSSDATITATFAQKADAPVVTGKTATGTYNGVVYGGATIAAVDSKLQGWSLSFKQGGTTISEPIAAGSYEMIASRSEDEAYAATTTPIGTLKIAKATASISEVKGSDIQVGDPLSKSVLSGVSDVEGTFAWTQNDQVMNTAGTNVKATVTFTSANANYENATGEATLKVVAKSAEVKTRTLTLTVNNSANGEAVKMTLDGTEVASGTAVKEGGKLVVTFKANSGSTASAKINDTAYTSGSTYTIGTEGDVKVVVIYTKTPTLGGGDDTDDDDTPTVITIQLDAVEKTLKVGDEFTLKATVTGSTDKIAWTSSDDKVATVIEGKVKAVKAGTTTITATIGQVKAECKVTVTAPTGLDEILAKSRVYGAKGLIVIEPAATMQIVITNLTGYNFYANEVSDLTRISVPAGIYLVSFSDGKGKITIKVSVH